MSPFSEMTEMDQNKTGRSPYLEIRPALALHLMNPNPSTCTHGDMDWGWAS